MNLYDVTCQSNDIYLLPNDLHLHEEHANCFFIFFWFFSSDMMWCALKEFWKIVPPPNVIESYVLIWPYHCIVHTRGFDHPRSSLVGRSILVFILAHPLLFSTSSNRFLGLLASAWLIVTDETAPTFFFLLRIAFLSGLLERSALSLLAVTTLAPEVSLND